MALSEFQLIRQYFASLTRARKDVAMGIGDDCALLNPPPGKQLAVTMDTLVAGHHFLPEADPQALGHKSLAVNLSDLAAMGAEPAWAMLSLTLPDVDQRWLAAFADGFSKLAMKHDVHLVGGDTTRGPLSVSIQVHGFVDRNKALRRDGASAGDLVYVTGQLGMAALELYLQQRGQLDWSADALDRPWPRVKEGMALVDIASAAIDVSDGLLADLGHICDASGTSACISCNSLPIDIRLERHIQSSRDWAFPLSGGDDYQLCFTVPAKRRHKLEQLQQQQGYDFTLIGEIGSEKGVKVLMPDGKLVEPAVGGFDHFK